MRANHFQSWRQECEAIEREMDRLIAEGFPRSVEERQVRRMRFQALIEQREAAARKLLKKPRAKEVAGDRLVSAAPSGGAAGSEDAKFAPFFFERGIAIAQVMIAASSSPVSPVSAGSDGILAARESADIANRSNASQVLDARPSELATPFIEAVASVADGTDDVPVSNRLPENAAGAAIGVAPHATDSAALPTGSAAGPVEVVTADADAAQKAEIAHGGDTAVLPAASAAALVAALADDAAVALQAELPNHSNTAALLTESASGAATGLAADATRPTGIFPQAPDVTIRCPDPAAITAADHLTDAGGKTDIGAAAPAPRPATPPQAVANRTISGLSTQEAKPAPVVRYNLNAAALTECAPAPAAPDGAVGRGVVFDAPHVATPPRDAAAVTIPVSTENATATRGVAVAAAASPSHSAPVPGDAAATPKPEVVHGPEPTVLGSESAVPVDASPSTKSAKHSSNASTLTFAESDLGIPAESPEIPADIALLAHSVTIPAARLPKVPDPLLPMDRTKTDDVHSDRSLLKLLQRLQSKLSRGGNETRDD